MISLSQGKIGVRYKIDLIDDLPFKIKRRLYELGFLSGQVLKISRVSLLKKAYLIEIDGYTLTLRRNILDEIKVSKA